MSTFTYGGTIGSTVGLDGEGRITQVTAGTGQNPVTGVNYNPYGTPPQQTVTFGSGDSDVFNYDPQTFRMTQYQFNVGTGGLSDKGVLTWNANSTLQKLAITDGFPSTTDTQTCTYSYDDMVRISTANCGSVASQSFVYDPFGNIDKSGSPNQFQPVYTNTRNRIYTVGSTTAQYDNNGNVLNDGVNTYTWDADGNSITVDAVGATFDALDRMVEQNRSSVYTEIVYAPTGAKLALMSGTTGQTLQNAFVKLPGKATAVYTSSGLDHYRHSDWLGSARLTSSPSQTVLSATAYAPFGETYATYPNPSASADPSFTGMNSDTVTGEYDFLYREYSTQGRWPSPDPAGLGAATPGNPQSWNRYAYALNNPLSIVDPTGRCGEDQSSGEPSATTENGDGSCGGGDTGNPIPPPQYDASITAQQSFDQFGNPCQCVLATINGKQVLIPTGSMIGPYGFMSSSADELNQAERDYATNVDYIFWANYYSKQDGPVPGDPCYFSDGKGGATLGPQDSYTSCKAANGTWVPPGWGYNVQPNGTITPARPAEPSPYFSPNTCFYLDWASSGLGIMAIPQTWEPIGWGLGIGAVAVWAISKVGGC